MDRAHAEGPRHSHQIRPHAMSTPTRKDALEVALNEVDVLEAADLWSEHPDPNNSRAEWQREVNAGETQRGYWDWVRANIEAEAEFGD
jgi:hypothetical protein